MYTNTSGLCRGVLVHLNLNCQFNYFSEYHDHQGSVVITVCVWTPLPLRITLDIKNGNADQIICHNFVSRVLENCTV